MLFRSQKRRSVCFLLSDFLDEDYDRALKVCMAKHDVVAVRVTDPAEQELPALGIVDFVDAETGRTRTVDTSSRAVRKAYRAQRLALYEATRRRMHKLGCDLVDLQTTGDLVGPLVKFFRTRTTRLRGGR